MISKYVKFFNFKAYTHYFFFLISVKVIFLPFVIEEERWENKISALKAKVEVLEQSQSRGDLQASQQVYTQSLHVKKESSMKNDS